MMSFRLAALGGITLAATFTSAPQEVPQYTLVEDLRIVAADSSGDAKLSRVTGLTVLSGGRIVTAHQYEHLVRVYDSTGKFVKSFGRRGGAAGEFGSIAQIHSMGDTLWSLDGANRRINILAADGRPVRTINGLFMERRPAPPNSPPPGVSEYITPLPTGRMLVTHTYRRPAIARSLGQADSVIYLVLDSTRNIVARVLAARLNERPRISYQERNSHIGIGQLLDSRVTALVAAGGGSFLLLSDAEVFGGQPGQVRLTSVQSDGRISNSVVSLPPLRVSPGYRDSTIANIVRPPMLPLPSLLQRPSIDTAAFEKTVRENLYVPEYHPVARYALLGRDGSLWLNYPYDGGQNFVVVIDGRPQMRVRTPPGAWLREVTREAAWGADTDSAGVTTIRRYRVMRATGG